MHWAHNREGQEICVRRCTDMLMESTSSSNLCLLSDSKALHPAERPLLSHPSVNVYAQVAQANPNAAA